MWLEFPLSRVETGLKFPRELLKYLDRLVSLRMGEPKDDLISKLVVEQLRPGHIEKSDAVQIAFLLLVAGNATMVNMIALVWPNPRLAFLLLPRI